METYEVTLYTRQNCSLCDKAKATIRSAIALRRLPVVFYEVDIDQDPELRARFTNDVPVIYVDGAEAFRHGLTAEQFETYLKGRKPVGLANEKCVPCRGGVPALKGEELHDLERELGNGWRVVGGHHLEKEFPFPDFVQALAFTNRIGNIAEEQGHHPDIYLAWGKVRVTIWTHKIDGLTRGDFILAAKIENAA